MENSIGYWNIYLVIIIVGLPTITSVFLHQYDILVTRKTRIYNEPLKLDVVIISIILISVVITLMKIILSIY